MRTRCQVGHNDKRKLLLKKSVLSLNQQVYIPSLIMLWASLVAQWQISHLPGQEIQETRVQSLCREDPLEKEIATHSRILTWGVPRTKEPDGLQPVPWVPGCGSQDAGHHSVEQAHCPGDCQSRLSSCPFPLRFMTLWFLFAQTC